MSLGVNLSLAKTGNVGFIGGGNMAQAIGFSALSKGVLKPEDIIVSAPSNRNLAAWKEKGVQTTNTNGQVLANGGLVFISVKPQYFREAIKSAYEYAKQDCNFQNILMRTTFVSIMVGLQIDQIRQVLEEELDSVNPLKIIRVMPNTPLLVGKGFSAVCINPAQRSKVEEPLKMVLDILKAGGESVEVEESQMDAVSAISGSGPAYMYTIIEALADGGVRFGLPRALALRLAAATMAGGAAMVLDSEQHPAQLRDAVCSPGGTTIAAVHALEHHSVRGMFMDAVEAAVKRAKELRN